jgi:hypothetical protein
MKFWVTLTQSEDVFSSYPRLSNWLFKAPACFRFYRIADICPNAAA